MTTVRLPLEIENKLSTIAQKQHKSKTEVIKEALEYFFIKSEDEQDSYELGKEYFGKYGSNDGTLSSTYKSKLKEKLHAKYNSN